MVAERFSDLVIEKYQVVYSFLPAISVIGVNISSSTSSWLFCMFPTLGGFMLNRRRRNELLVFTGDLVAIATENRPGT